MTATAKIARFIRTLDFAAVPPEVAEKTRTCLLNGYGIALGCHDTPYAPVARRAALAIHGEQAGGATLLGDGRKTSVPGAALANPALFHGRAQEDTCGAAHLGTIMIPLLTAMVEARGYPLARLLPALLAGYETGGLLEKAYAGDTTPAGFRASPVYGTLAAAGAAAKLMDLPEERIAAALANAASFCGGILQSFTDGTDEWRYQVGIAAQIGHLQAVSGVRVQPDAGHCGPRAAGQTRRGRNRGRARPHEPLRNRICRHGRDRTVRLGFGHLDEHSLLHRGDAAARCARHEADDDLR